MRRALTVTLGSVVIFGLLAAALNLNSVETDVLTLAVVPPTVLLALGVKPAQLAALRRRSQ